MSAAAFILGAAIGAAVVAICMVRHGKRLFEERDPVIYGTWLNKECDALFGKRWLRCRVVAVSRKGAVAVRNIDDHSGQHAKWICAKQVPERIRWSR